MGRPTGFWNLIEVCHSIVRRSFELRIGMNFMKSCLKQIFAIKVPGAWIAGYRSVI